MVCRIYELTPRVILSYVDWSQTRGMPSTPQSLSGMKDVNLLVNTFVFLSQFYITYQVIVYADRKIRTPSLYTPQDGERQELW